MQHRNSIRQDGQSAAYNKYQEEQKRRDAEEEERRKRNNDFLAYQPDSIMPDYNSSYSVPDATSYSAPDPTPASDSFSGGGGSFGGGGASGDW